MPWDLPDLTDSRSKNLLRWLDMERAYQFVERYAPYSITGDMHAFLWAVFQRCLLAAMADSFQCQWLNVFIEVAVWQN